MVGFLFYSKKCDACRKLMTVMENQGLLTMFSIKCVDEMSEVETVRLELKVVPTLVLINNQNGQQIKGLYEQKKAFEWVEAVIANRRQNMIKYAENTRKLIQIAEMKKRFKDGVFDYCQNEHEGLSDTYAYWKDDLALDVNTNAQPKTFLPVGHDEKYTIMTIPENNAMVARNKLTKGDQEKLIQKEISTREQQDLQIKTVMERQQIDSVINNANNMQY